jgi:hypothetical protein
VINLYPHTFVTIRTSGPFDVELTPQPPDGYTDGTIARVTIGRPPTSSPASPAR